MTQVIAIKSDASTKEIQLKLFENIQGACNADGTWKRGWEPTIQSYVRKEGVGEYIIVHNLNKLYYSLNISLLEEGHGSFEVSEQNEVSFRLKITKDKEPIDRAFRFSICIIGD